MNFKPNLWKVVASVFIGILADFCSGIFISMNCDPLNCSNNALWSARFETMMLTKNASFSVILIVLVYIIWSLLEKDKMSRKEWVKNVKH